MYPDLEKTPGGRPAITTRDFAIVHSTIQKDLIRTKFKNVSHYMRCASIRCDPAVKHDAPRDAFAMMVMGNDTYKKFKNNPNRWDAMAKVETFATETHTRVTRSTSRGKPVVEDSDGDNARPRRNGDF